MKIIIIVVTATILMILSFVDANPGFSLLCNNGNIIEGLSNR